MKTAAVLVLSLVTSRASAQPTIELVPTCVEIDATHDELPEGERPAARLLLVRALERLDQLIVESGCRDTITLSHMHDGGSIHVRLANAQTRRKLTVSIREDMLAVYTRMSKSLLEPPPPPAVEAPIEEAAPIETPAITESLPEEPPELKPGSWYAMFGLGIHDSEGGRGVAFGYRYGHAYKLDLGMSITGSDGATTTAFRGQVLKLEKPGARMSLYYGMGLSYASTEMTMSSGVRDQSGARIESTGGIELARNRSRRLYVEGNLSIPLYDVAGNYPVAFVAAIGAGF